MSTLHLVEIDADENIVEELEVDDDVLQALEEDEDTELSLSDDDNEVYLVELDDDGDIVDAVAIGQDDDEDTELSLSDRVDGLELSIASMLGKGAIGAGRAITGKARSGFGAVKKSFAHGGAGDNFVRKTIGHKGRTAGIKMGRAVKNAAVGGVNMVKRNPLKSAAAGGYVGGRFDGAVVSGRNKQREQGKKPTRFGGMLSLSADQLLSPDYNPLLADVESRYDN